MSFAIPRIAIIGGGPGGLTLLLTLHRRGIPATLYERDIDFNARSHLGGTLDLGYASGQRALRDNGLEDTFKFHSRPEGDTFKISDGAGNILITSDDRSSVNPHPEDPKDVRPEIDRTVLRRILLDACPADSIKWGHTLVSARPLGDGTHELIFSNDTFIVCDVLVGADGANSRVRPLVSAARSTYTGVNGAEISLAPSVVSRPDMTTLREFVGHGTVLATENARTLGFQMNGDGRVRVYAWFRGPAEWTLPLDTTAARAVLKDLYAGWALWMLQAIDHSDEQAMFHRPLFSLPIGHRWDHVRGVTLIGDAAHQMCPFSGEGANLAMLDGLKLGIVLVGTIVGGSDADTREAAIVVWEQEMLDLAEKVAVESQANMDVFISPDAPRSVIDAMKAKGLKAEVKFNEFYSHS